MDIDTGRRLIAAARVLLRWDVAEFAAALDVGVATIKRIEAHYAVREETVRVTVSRLARLGIEVSDHIPERGIVAGLALKDTARVADPRPRKSSAKKLERRQGSAPRSKSSA